MSSRDGMARVAYRRVRRTGQLHGRAFQQTLLALRAVRPELTERQAAEQTTDAILRVLRSSRLALERSRRQVTLAGFTSVC